MRPLHNPTRASNPASKADVSNPARAASQAHASNEDARQAQNDKNRFWWQTLPPVASVPAKPPPVKSSIPDWKHSGIKCGPTSISAGSEGEWKEMLQRLSRFVSLHGHVSDVIFRTKWNRPSCNALLDCSLSESELSLALLTVFQFCQGTGV